MFKHIMFPVDLHLPPEVSKAVDVVSQVAKWQGAKITIVSVTGRQPGDRDEEDGMQSAELKDLADQLARQSGAEIGYHAIHSVDVGAEVDSDLTRAVRDIGADLIVVGTHAPRITDHVFSSHAGYLAKHADASVFVVR